MAGVVHGDVQMMIPMLSSLSGILEQSLSLIRQVCAELEKEGAIFRPDIPIGGMIEVPAAAIAAISLRRNSTFFPSGPMISIQYTLAIDRVDAVNYLYDPLHPSVLRLVRNIIQAGKAAGIPVSMCGEMVEIPCLPDF